MFMTKEQQEAIRQQEREILRYMEIEGERAAIHWERCERDPAAPLPLSVAISPELYDIAIETCPTCNWTRSVARRKNDLRPL